MKKSLILVALGLLGTAALAEETGRVISSVPVIQQVAVQRQVCNPQQVVTQQQPQSSGGGAVIGAIVGGLLGNTIGHGTGHAAATGLGVIAGAAVGDRIQNRPAPIATTQQACSTQTSYENRTVGYNVTYEYGGKQFQVQMPYEPGPTIRLQVTPVGSSAMPPPPQTLAPTTQVMPTVIEPAVTVMPAPVVYYPSYYYRPYYPPVSISLGFGYWGGHHHHRHFRHWR